LLQFIDIELFCTKKKRYRVIVGTQLIIVFGCWVGEIECLLNINYKTNDVYSQDPFKHLNGVLHCGWSKRFIYNTYLKWCKIVSIMLQNKIIVQDRLLIIYINQSLC